MQPYAPLTKNIEQAVDIIRQGRGVAFPTGTSYGLAADALQGHALQRVRNLKHRPADKALTVYMDPSLYEAHLELTAAEKDFITKNAGQAITLLVKPKASLGHLAQDGRIGLRFIDHPLMAALAEAARVPLTATSANISDTPACFDIACLKKNFPGRLPDEHLRWYEPADLAGAKDTTYDLSLGCMVDGGTLPARQASTIIRLDCEKITVIRPGKAKSVFNI